MSKARHAKGSEVQEAEDTCVSVPYAVKKQVVFTENRVSFLNFLNIATCAMENL